MSNQFTWAKIKLLSGKIRLRVDYDWDPVVNTDPYLNEIQEWTEQTKCGRRMAYDLWEFDNEEQVTAFMLKWS